MQTYFYSLIVGIFVGAIYAGVSVKSPAPPVIALIGLLGILIGESSLPLIKTRFLNRPPANEVPIQTPKV